MNRSKKISMAATALLCFILLLSACSEGKPATNEESTAKKQVETNAMKEENQKSDSSETRIYKDSQGHEIEIPTNPKRIVLQGNPIGDLLALGIEPVGIDRRFVDASSALDKEVITAQDIGYPTNLEMVLSLAPDLTMLSYILDKEYEEASKISPVVTFDGGLPLKERFPVIADIVGKKVEAEQLLQDYDLKAEAMWKEIRANGKIVEGETAVVLQYYWNKSMYVMKTGGLAELLYQPSGFGMDDKVKALQPNSGPYIEVSNELMHDMLIGDRLFVLHSADKDAEKAFAELLKSNLWKSLPAVKSGKINFIEDKWNYNDMTTSAMLLDEFPGMMEQ